MKKIIFILLALASIECQACVNVDRENSTYTVDEYGAPKEDQSKWIKFRPTNDPYQPTVDDTHNWMRYNFKLTK